LVGYYLKVVNFISGKDLGGPKQSFLLYSKALKNSNIEVVSIIKKGAKLAKLLKLHNLPYKEIFYIRSTSIFFKKQAVEKIKNELFDIKGDIYLVHKQVDIELIRNALGNQTKIVGIIHGFNAKHIEGADILFAVSNKVKEFLINNGYKKPIYVIPNMIETNSKYSYKNMQKPVIIGSMGIFRRKKGFHILIEALGILKQRGVEFKAYIAGKGKRYIYLKYLQKKYNLNKELEFVGWIDNKDRDEFLNKLDIYCLPSLSESFGMAALEAMSKGKVTVATKCGGPEEFIQDGINGILANKNSAIDLANKLEDVINQQDNLKNISKNAYNFASKYDANIIIKDVINIIKDL
jgi:glycosyltransferase involved in cell wall biosynthesis